MKVQQCPNCKGFDTVLDDIYETLELCTECNAQDMLITAVGDINVEGILPGLIVEKSSEGIIIQGTPKPQPLFYDILLSK